MTDEQYEEKLALGEKHLREVAKSNNEECYEIVEDTYEYENGLLLIAYCDEDYECEKYILSIDLEKSPEEWETF